jgi:hypothetical protein
VIIPNGVTNIAFAAFQDCTGLTSVTIPDSVTEIRTNAFEGCSGLTSVTIPNRVTDIGDYAFHRCSGLTSVTIPDSVTEIGGSAFYGCTRLTSVIIPNSVTEIGRSAFRVCTGLLVVVVENPEAEINDGAFAYCSRLSLAVVPVPVAAVLENRLRCFDACPLLGPRDVVPESVGAMRRASTLRHWSRRHHHLLPMWRRQWVWTVFAVAVRVRGTLEVPGLPSELWHMILERVALWELGVRLFSSFRGRRVTSTMGGWNI